MINKHLVFLFTLLISSHIQAATFSNTHIIDKGIYSIDTKTGIEWLDLSQTAGLSYNDVSSMMGVGQKFEGWRYANAAQLHTLFDGFGGNGVYAGWSQENNGLFDAIAHTWGDLYAEYKGWTPGQGYSFAIYGEVDIWGYVQTAQIYDHKDMSLTETQEYVDLNLDIWEFERNKEVGSSLIRTAQVPEPTTMMLMGLGFLGLARMKRTMS